MFSPPIFHPSLEDQLTLPRASSILVSFTFSTPTSSRPQYSPPPAQRSHRLRLGRPTSTALFVSNSILLHAHPCCQAPPSSSGGVSLYPRSFLDNECISFTGTPLAPSHCVLSLTCSQAPSFPSSRVSLLSFISHHRSNLFHSPFSPSFSPRLLINHPTFRPSSVLTRRHRDDGWSFRPTTEREARRPVGRRHGEETEGRSCAAGNDGKVLSSPRFLQLSVSVTLVSAGPFGVSTPQLKTN